MVFLLLYMKSRDQNVVTNNTMEVTDGLVTIPCPWDRINIFSKLTFSWLWSLFIWAHKKDLDFSDLYRCPESDETHRVRQKLEINWDKQLKSKGNPSLYWALIASFGPKLIVLYIPDAIREMGVNLFQPYCIVYLVRYFNKDPNTSQWWAQWAAVGIVMAAIANVFIISVKQCWAQNPCRLLCPNIPQVSRSLFVAPLQTAIVLYLLWLHLRWACLTGMGIIVLFIPFQVLMGRMSRSIRQKTAELTDSRIRLMHEIIAGMRVIKMYAWEQPFALLVATARKSEVKQCCYSNFLKGLNLSINFVIIRVIIYACFLTYVLMGGMLSAETAFATIAYFNALRWSVGINVPEAITTLSELIIVIERIQTFLLLEEMSGLDERERKDNEAFISGENELILGVIENTSSVEEKGIFMDKMSVRWNNICLATRVSTALRGSSKR
ncbi:unnamed protein product [Medioppia subpectinata]|uniref:ABC transmembrane type-1 domain-containing protein n=1 Tax=Medioppia subpectinata TaxID=1979941 RepID=A0A7R9Q6T1_9ACAR|nr:unnamed protein product [Medioppia subpectinata]CAG2114053.1 unnamed protein product [Medioppia subpectinata]